MKKIKSVFVRNYEGNRKVRDQVVEGSEWVLKGEGIATRKWDGLAVLIKDQQIYIRYDAKQGRTPPDSFIPCEPQPDPHTGHWPGWVLPGKGQDKHILAYLATLDTYPADGTYEFCGPSVGTRHGPNPEFLIDNVLIPHGKDIINLPDRSFTGIKAYLRDLPIEGIVFHHPDGRMAKIKRNDFDY